MSWRNKEESWEKRKVFSVGLQQGLQRRETVLFQELIQFLKDEKTPAEMLQSCPRMTLLRMARDKYFKKETPDYKKLMMPPILAHSADVYPHLRSLLPTQLVLKNQRSL